MRNKAIGTAGRLLVKNASKVKFWASKHAPELLTAAGVAGFGGTIYLACKGTLKAEEALKDAEVEKGLIKTALDSSANYTEEDSKKVKEDDGSYSTKWILNLPKPRPLN